MRKLLPIALVLVGLGAGIGAGVALKPATACAAGGEAAGEAEGAAAPHGAMADAPCAEPDAEHSDAAPAGAHGEAATGPEYVAIEKPFVVPVFRDERVAALVVLSLSVEVGAGRAESVAPVQPRLRDNFLVVLFRHANSGGFDGSFTSGQKIEDLKSALLAVAREVLPAGVDQVLITEIVRQDV